MLRPRSLHKASVTFLGFASVLASLLSAAGESKTASPKFDPASAQATWEGWGTSLCWWAKVFGDRDDIADWLFTLRPEATVGDNVVPGLGLTIARYNAGACSPAEIDGRRMVVSKTILPFRQLDAFWVDGRDPDPASASWDWSLDSNQRASLLKARDRGADRFELFSNSPPWWMCVNDNPSGGPKGDVENLRPEYREAFAHYLAAVARRAKEQWGVAFTTVAPFNEPSSSYWFANGKQEGCHFSPKSQAEILPLMRAALDREGLADLPLSASDETYYDHAVTAWERFPAEVRALVAQVNVHGYQGKNGRRAYLHEITVERDGKRLWNSEHGDKEGDGLHMAAVIHRDFFALRPSAWCYWQPLDGGAGGKGGSGWGLIDANLLSARILKANPKAYVLAQYSRHIRPGMTVLRSGDERVVAAYDAGVRRLVLVALNADAEAVELRPDLAGFRARGARVARWLTEPRGETRYLRLADSVLGSDTPSWTLLPRSVLTVQIDGVAP